MWNVETLKNCKVCGKPIEGKRFRSYCSEKCRNKLHNHKHYPQQKLRAQEKRGAYASNKRKCLICGKWYVQVGTHIIQVHRITTRQYREEFDLPLKRGITPDWYHEAKADKVDEIQKANLEQGAKFRFKKGDPRARIPKRGLGWKSSPNAVKESEENPS